jgi:uncharacterized protein
MKNAILLVAAALAATSPAALMAAEIHIEAKNPVVELSVSEMVESAPDTATFSTGVETAAPTASVALRQNSTQVARVISQLKAMGIAEKDIQTSGINLSPEYEYIQATQRNRFKGYRVSNQVQVKMRDIEKLGTIMDQVVASGATNINGPYFSIADDSAVKRAARATALANGKAQAETYARAAGYSGVRLLSVSEAVMGRPMPYAMMRQTANVEAMDASVPVQPGQVGTSVMLNLQYEMVR